MANKYASDLPLPGGVEQYFDTLTTLLRRVNETPMKQEQLAETISEVCPNARKSTAIGMYISLISRMGFWSSKEDVFKPTPEGHALLEKADCDPSAAKLAILETKIRDVSGYDTVFGTLQKGPATFDVVDSELKTKLNVDWKSKNQTMFRLNWLRSLGYVVREGHDYKLTDAGNGVLANGLIPPTKPEPGGEDDGDSGSPPPQHPSPLSTEAMAIADAIQKAAIAGGDGSELEVATAKAFEFLGFSVQLISGSGNPDIVATALMGENTYRVLVETKSRSSGTISQNDVNFNALTEHKLKASADYVVIFGADFGGGNLEKWAAEQTFRLLRAEELRQVLLAHAEAAIPLDRMRELFLGGGSTDEGTLSSLLADSESASQLMSLCRQVYDAILNHQDEEATLTEDSLYYILGGAHSIQAINVTTELLQSDLLCALGQTDSGSLFCRLSPKTLADRLQQIRNVIGNSTDSGESK